MIESSARRVEADAFGKVETHGIDAISAAERHGRPRELGFLWAGAFTNYASLFTASLLTTYFGLGVWDGLAATVLGTVAAAVILGLLSNTGPRSGLPQIVFTRGIFGRRGSYLGAALTLFLAVGWFAVDCVIAAQAGAQLFGGGNRLITFGLVILIAAISVAVAVYGHGTIKVLETYGAVIFAALAAILFILLAPEFRWGHGPSVSGADYPGAFVLGEIWANYLDVYTAGLVTLTMGIRLQRWQTALGCGILGTALAAYAVLVTDLHVAYEDFLILTYLWAPAWAAVVLLSFFVFEGKARPRLAIIAWLTGTAVSLLFVNYTNLFSNLGASTPSHYFNDGLVGGLHGADASGLISIAVAAAVYWGGRRLRAAS